MQINDLPIESITPYAGNPRTITDAAVQKVANSLNCFGWQQPIVVDKDMVIIVGHTRYLAAKQLDFKTAPVLVAENLSDEQVRAYRIADNRTHEENGWDQSLLIKELEQINAVEVEMLTGFNADELNDYLSGFDMSGMESGVDVPVDHSNERVGSVYEIIIALSNEHEQQALFKRLQGEGHKCRVLTA